MPEGKEDFDDLIEGIYQGEIKSALAEQVRTKFRPWHKPRKHYIRLHQWCHETRALLKKIKLVEGEELRYLGLPGEDLLDIRVLKGVCEREKVSLRYLGFDSSLKSAELNLSRHEVNSDSFIHPASVVISDNLEQLTKGKTVANQYVLQHAPFDVINLDLCDCVTGLGPAGTVPNLEAIRTLCDIQIKSRGKPWLLFLTTRAIRSQMSAEIQGKLFEKLLKNISDHVEFSTEIGSRLGLDEQSIRRELEASESCLGPDEWFNAYVMGVSKWLLHYMMNHEYSIAVRMLPSYSYSVEEGAKDMVSLAFQFEPNASERIDDSGLTQARTVGGNSVEEKDLACLLVKRVAEIRDVDLILASDDTLKEKIFKKSAALLATLRYDMREYQKFAFRN